MIEITADVALRDHTWWKIGGPAERFCLPKSVAEVGEVLALARAEKWAVTVLGGGTNVLVGDAGIPGLVLATRDLRGLGANEVDGRLEITALAGTPKAELTREFLKRRLAPALFLCGLPGDVGGGVVMNAGVGEALTPREFHEITDWIEVCRGDEVKRIPKDEIAWSYRHSDGWQPGVVVRAGFSWPLAPDPEIPARVKLATRERLRKQPLDLPSCGSTFKNPPGRKAGQLIERAGLKGHQVGGAQVSLKHANFIVNLGGATAHDVRRVIDHVRATVLARDGVVLEPEVKFLGR